LKKKSNFVLGYFKIIIKMATTVIKKEKSSTRYKKAVFPNQVLLDFISNKNKKSLKDLKGKISFMDYYDYKSMR